MEWCVEMAGELDSESMHACGPEGDVACKQREQRSSSGSSAHQDDRGAAQVWRGSYRVELHVGMFVEGLLRRWGYVCAMNGEVWRESGSDRRSGESCRGGCLCFGDGSVCGDVEYSQNQYASGSSGVRLKRQQKANRAQRECSAAVPHRSATLKALMIHKHHNISIATTHASFEEVWRSAARVLRCARFDCRLVLAK